MLHSSGPFPPPFCKKKKQFQKHLPYIETKKFEFRDVAQVVILHKKYLAKFGCIQNMKAEKILSASHIVASCAEFWQDF
jgi:hypothetical protein